MFRQSVVRCCFILSVVCVHVYCDAVVYTGSSVECCHVSPLSPGGWLTGQLTGCSVLGGFVLRSGRETKGEELFLVWGISFNSWSGHFVVMALTVYCLSSCLLFMCLFFFSCSFLSFLCRNASLFSYFLLFLLILLIPLLLFLLLLLHLLFRILLLLHIFFRLLIPSLSLPFLRL